MRQAFNGGCLRASCGELYGEKFVCLWWLECTELRGAVSDELREGSRRVTGEFLDVVSGL